MLGYLIPDGLQRVFVGIATGGPLAVQGVAFSALCIGFLLVVSFAMRWALLFGDASAALRARRAGHEPGPMAHATGWVGQGQWWTLTALCALFAISAVGFELGRRGSLDSAAPEAAFQAARWLHLCLRPSSGNQGDSLRQCAFE